MSTDNAMSLPLGTILDGKYRLDDILGQGGFGITYKAQDIKLNRAVAIKECLPVDFAWRQRTTVIPKTSSAREDFAWALQRFRDEGKMLAKFNHPSIVKVYDIFDANGTAYLVTKYEAGQNFTNYIKYNKHTFSESNVLAILNPILQGLKEIHNAGILHRDIKPDNIFITEKGNPILLDFGSARLAVHNKTHSLTTLVSSGYAPLEQYHEDGSQGPWSDLYSLAGCIYYMLTGEVPPDATKRFRPGKQDVYCSIEERLRGKFSKNLLSSIDKALNIDEKERPQNVREFEALLFTGISPISQINLENKKQINEGKHTEKNNSYEKIITGVIMGGLCGLFVGGVFYYFTKELIMMEIAPFALAVICGFAGHFNLISKDK